MISAISWVPKGIAKSVPSVAEPPSKEEIEEIIKSGALEAGDAGDEEDEEAMELEADKEVDEIAHASVAAEMLGTASDDISDALKELDMDNYDDEDNDGIQLFSKGLGDSFYPTNDLDPYLKDKDEDDSEEEEDMTIKPDDVVLVCAREDDDISQLEVYILEETEDGSPNMYVHHDIIITAFPLSTAWLDCPLKGGERGNFIAVGSMEPSIDIWDLDIIDEVQPCLTLGGIVEKKKKGKKVELQKVGISQGLSSASLEPGVSSATTSLSFETRKSIKYKVDSHTDSVLGLAWNKEFRNILASGSADKSVKLWDVATGSCKMTMDHHTDKVQAVAWNHFAPEVLLSGSFDHTVVLRDGRKPSHSGYKWSVDADVEALAWDPHAEHSFVVSLESGMVQGFDIRTASSDPDAKQKPSFTLHAHNDAVCSICYNPSAPNLLATGSKDKTVKLWDLSNNQPNCVATNNPKAGAVFSISFCEDMPLILAIGGSKGKLQVWDTMSDTAIAHKFGSYRRKKSS